MLYSTRRRRSLLVLIILQYNKIDLCFILPSSRVYDWSLQDTTYFPDSRNNGYHIIISRLYTEELLNYKGATTKNKQKKVCFPMTLLSPIFCFEWWLSRLNFFGFLIQSTTGNFFLNSEISYQIDFKMNCF